VAESLRGKVVELGIAHPASSAGPVVSVSIGIATTIPQIGCDAAELLAAADGALYEAKRAGRNRVVAAAQR
jgi:diguanylate cyclase (GGDEF)-like protein